MSHAVDAQIAELVLGAEEAGSCLVLPAGASGSLRRALERRVATGELVSPARGLYARAHRWNDLKRDQQTLELARGLQALHPTWVFCGPTAAVIWGADVSWDLQRRIHVATTRSAYASGGLLIMRHACLDETDPEKDVEVTRGLRVTSADRTVFDCLRTSAFPLGLGVADSALRLGLVTREGIEDFIASGCPRARGKSRALGTLAWADPRSENGGESIARARMLQLGYARPELQVEVPRLVEEGEPFRADYVWVRADGLVIIGELDGTDKYVDGEMTRGRSLDEVLSDERARGSRISLYNVSVMRFRFALTRDQQAFSALLDEYGVPKRGSALELPAGASRLPNWDALRRR